MKSSDVKYVYRVRDKQTGEYHGFRRSIWTRKHNAEANFPHPIKEGKYEVVMFELKEVKNPCQDCGVVKDDNKWRLCPYDLDIHGQETWVYICDDCEGRRADEV